MGLHDLGIISLINYSGKIVQPQAATILFFQKLKNIH